MHPAELLLKCPLTLLRHFFFTSKVFYGKSYNRFVQNKDVQMIPTILPDIKLNWKCNGWSCVLFSSKFGLISVMFTGFATEVVTKFIGDQELESHDNLLSHLT